MFLCTRNSTFANDQDVICGNRSKTSLKNLEHERDELKLIALRYQKESLFCHSLCDEVHERYKKKDQERQEREEALRGRSNKLLACQTPAAQFASWKAFNVDYDERLRTIMIPPEPRREIVEPPVIVRQLTPYPGKTEKNVRVTPRSRASSSLSPRNSSTFVIPGPISSISSTCNQEQHAKSGDARKRSSGATTLVAHSPEPSTSVPADQRPHDPSHCSIIPVKLQNPAIDPDPRPIEETVFPNHIPRAYTAGFLHSLKAFYRAKKLALCIKRKDVPVHRQMLLTDIKRLRNDVIKAKEECRELWEEWWSEMAMGVKEFEVWFEDSDGTYTDFMMLSTAAKAGDIQADANQKGKERRRSTG